MSRVVFTDPDGYSSIKLGLNEVLVVDCIEDKVDTSSLLVIVSPDYRGYKVTPKLAPVYLIVKSEQGDNELIFVIPGKIKLQH